MKKTQKSKKGSKKTRLVTPTRVLIAGLSAIVLLLVAAVVVLANNQANKINDNPEPVRELVLLAVRGAKKDAPVDPKTGDIYFPESRLYLPNPGFVSSLTYLYDTGDISDSQGELSISTYPVYGSTKVYTAQTSTELFKQVPKLQACSRGVKIVSKKFSQSDTNNELKHEVRLNNGKTVYIYVEKDCPDINPIANVLAGIKSY